MRFSVASRGWDVILLQPAHCSNDDECHQLIA